MTEHTTALARFNAEIALAKGPDAAFTALQKLVQDVVGAKLFTVMIVDMAKEESRRAFTSHPVDYPVSTTPPAKKPAWRSGPSAGNCFLRGNYTGTLHTLDANPLPLRERDSFSAFSRKAG